MKNEKDPASLIRIEEVEELVGLDRSTIYRRIAKGEFPEQQRPTESGYAARWRRGDILEWNASRPKRRRRDPQKARESRAKKQANNEEPAKFAIGGLDMTYAMRALVTPGSPTDVLLDVHSRHFDDDWEALAAAKKSLRESKSKSRPKPRD